jgi:hypothetical protein
VDLTEYTSFAEVRAILGVSEDEVEDATLGLPVYATNLEAELRDVSLSLPTSYQAVRAKIVRTPEEDWFFRITQQFAAHVVAKQCLTALPMAAPREMSDGKASMSRFADSPYRDTIRRVESDLETNRTRLKAALDAVNASATIITRQVYFARSSSVDPVTGA